MALLEGLRVLAVEQYGAGPFGTQALADLGAEVVKIESFADGGDVTRSLGPYFEPSLGETAGSLFFQALNRNKSSIALDLAKDEGRGVFARLVADADAVACNVRGDVPGRLGLTYDVLGKVNPKIVCCHLTGYGRDGSRARWPGYDYLIQAEAGYFMLSGEPDAPPARFGLSVVDFMTGYCLALSVVSGVLNARATGVGRDIDISLFDVGIANLNYLAAWNLNRGVETTRAARSAHPTLVPCQLFPTRDGWIFIMANKEKFFPILCEKLGCPELSRDPRFYTFPLRHANRVELIERLDTAFRTRTTAEWLAVLGGKVPAAPVLGMADALQSPFVAERGMVQEIAAESGTTMKVVGSPFRTGDPAPSRAAPTLGRDTDAILRAAGYDAAAISDLRRLGVIG